MNSNENMPTMQELEDLSLKVSEGNATRDEVLTAIDHINNYDSSSDDINGLILSISRSVDDSSLIIHLVPALENARTPGKAILLMKALRNKGLAGRIVPILLEIVDGVAWDPDGSAWIVALRTLADHARKTGDRRARGAVERTALKDGLTALQESWARRCLAVAREGAP